MVARPLLVALTLALALHSAAGQAQGQQQQPQVRWGAAARRRRVSASRVDDADPTFPLPLPLPVLPAGLHSHFQGPLCCRQLPRVPVQRCAHAACILAGWCSNGALPGSGGASRHGTGLAGRCCKHPLPFSHPLQAGMVGGCWSMRWTTPATSLSSSSRPTPPASTCSASSWLGTMAAKCCSPLLVSCREGGCGDCICAESALAPGSMLANCILSAD